MTFSPVLAIHGGAGLFNLILLVGNHVHYAPDQRNGLWWLVETVNGTALVFNLACFMALAGAQ